MAPGLRDIPEETTAQRPASPRPIGTAVGTQIMARLARLRRSAGPPLLNAIMLVVLAVFVLAPFLFPGTKALDVAARSASSSSWWRASTSCSATPASSRSRTRCSSASAPMAWPSARHRLGSAGGRSRRRRGRARRLAGRRGRDRPVQPARARDLLLDDHARGRRGFALILASQHGATSPAARTA